MVNQAGKAMSLGSIMVDLQGTSMTSQERERLLDPKVAGVILFSRNFESVEQLQALTTEIHKLRHPRLLIGVDHEGGRVQRFRQGFTHLPPMRLLGALYQKDKKASLDYAHKIGWLMAAELLSVGVDFSFAPVLDLDYGGSKVIGDRAFAAQPKEVGELALHLMNGMKQAGMASVGKHFPGHGFIEADTHTETAIDPRTLQQIQQQDMQPFLSLIENGLDAIMPAHVIYPQVDSKPAGFSEFWLQRVLRQQCHFEGAIISDDLSMQAAVEYGDVTQRVEAALQAGCDLVLVCNDPQAADQVLAKVQWVGDLLSHARLIRLHAHHQHQIHKLRYEPLWQAAVQAVDHLNAWAEKHVTDNTAGEFSASLLN
ncbi:beta-N-acetylhexosaminidase [Thiomicrorhabdus xiamenensis]|uniref:Beta-hexosaminidase n=1 Tax=Thiomicrorhabdus xiamenensis TaxID=2739063 RepID=A0A7D4NQW6_9GAMM|nr:beta-N-acetylhexosaminidase [Thiomicrorhabdus xiamenensis]QKI89272.1 beta-N-acetylhexosaminidase [Thiomicrorhabdus xiamenensis]